MPQFHDAEQRPWECHLTIGSLRRVREAHGLDLKDVAGDALQRAVGDPETLCAIWWTLVAEKAAGRDVSRESFEDAFRGDAIEEAAGALIEGLADFFPRRLGAVLRAALAKGRAVQDEQLAKAHSALETSTDSSTSSPASSASTPSPSPSAA